MAFLEVQDLKKNFDGKIAVDGISLSASEGEIIVLLGPSGCGKTTFLRLLAGLEVPDSGYIRLSNRDISSIPPHSRNIAMVFQNYALYPHMTARQNMEFALNIAKIFPNDVKRAVEQTAEMLDITKLLDKRPAECSGGERQRIALGRAIVRRPALFLFDEPLSNLDAGLRESLRVELRSLLKSLNATALYVTHDQAEAMTLADRTAVIENGALRQFDTPRAIYDSPSSVFVATFLGKPKANEFTGICEKGEFRCELGFTMKCPALLIGKVLLLIRPERMRPSSSGILAGDVISTEYQGNRTVLHFDCKGRRYAAVTSERPESISRLVLYDIPFEDAMWFDATTGVRLA